MATTTGTPYHLVHWCSCNNRLAAFRRQYLVTASTGGGPPLSHAADILANLTASYLRPLLCSSARYHGAAIYADSTSLSTPAALSPHLNQTGTGGVIPLPYQVCGLIRTTALGNSDNARIGRLYVPFPTATDNNNAVPNGPYLSKLLALASILHGAFQIDGTHPGPPPTPYTSTWVPAIFTPGTGTGFSLIGAQAVPRWTTQRRRARLPPTVTSPFPM